MNCPAPEYLVRHAFGDPGSNATVAGHVRECASCRRHVRSLRELASAFDPATPGDAPVSPDCLGEDELAAVAEGIDSDGHGRWIGHLTACDQCRSRLAGLMRVLADGDIAEETQRLDRHVTGASARRFQRPSMAVAATLAAAVAGVVLVRPAVGPNPLALDEPGSSPHRESAITTTIAPRILGPVGPASVTESLVWTRVPHAARYRARVFNQEGTLVWDAQTRDTTLALPRYLRGDTANTYLWKIEARTGLDRWVASEWRELVIRSETPTR